MRYPFFIVGLLYIGTSCFAVEPCMVIDRVHSLAKSRERSDQDPRDPKVAAEILADLVHEFPDVHGWVAERDGKDGAASVTLVMPDGYVWVIRYDGHPISEWVVTSTGQKEIV